jgi:hypothetical protein
MLNLINVSFKPDSGKEINPRVESIRSGYYPVHGCQVEERAEGGARETGEGETG